MAYAMYAAGAHVILSSRRTEELLRVRDQCLQNGISETCVAVCCSVLQCVAVGCSVLQCVAVCCSVLQCVAVCCSVLQSALHVCLRRTEVLLHVRT